MTLALGAGNVPQNELGKSVANAFIAARLDRQRLADKLPNSINVGPRDFHPFMHKLAALAIERHRPFARA